MSITYIIRIPNWHPVKVNELIGENRFVANRKKIQTTEAIWAYAKKLNIPPAETKRHVHIAIYRNKGRMPDADAFYKSVHDALVSIKLLVDDSPKWLDHQATDIRTGDKATIITLRDA